MNFFKITAGIIITLIVVAIAGYYVGTSQWFAKLFAPKVPEVTPCLINNEKPGILINGICVEGSGSGGPANPPLTERFGYYTQTV